MHGNLPHLCLPFLRASATRRAALWLALAPLAWLGRDQGAARGQRNRKKKLKTRLDLSCPGPSFGGLGMSGDGRFAQTFIAARKGELVRAEVTIYQEAVGAGDFALHLAPVDAAGVPTATVRASASIDNAKVLAGEVVLLFAFKRPAKVKAGVAYALVLSRPGGSPYTAVLGSGLCGGGEPFFSDAVTGDFTGVSNPPRLTALYRTFVRA